MLCPTCPLILDALHVCRSLLAAGMAFPLANMTCSCTITPASSAHRRSLQESNSITGSASRGLQVCTGGDLCSVWGAGR